MIDKSGFPIEFEDKLSHLPEDEREEVGRIASRHQAERLESSPIKGAFDSKHFATIHECLFKDVSSNAGIIRDYNMRKGSSQFADPLQISYLLEKELPQRVSSLEQVTSDAKKYASAMADLHSTLDLAHPFRDGNGRATRAFMSQLANKHGYELDFTGIERKQWVNSCIDSINTGQETLKAPLFDNIVKPNQDRLRDNSATHQPEKKPQLWVIAGCNGAGKSTFAEHHLHGKIPIINPDNIAKEINPNLGSDLSSVAMQAGRIAIRKQKQYLEKGASFAIETTLTGKQPFRLIMDARFKNYKVNLIYIGIKNKNLSNFRIAMRTKAGGHFVSSRDVERRYPRSMNNLNKALKIADRSLVMDNTQIKRRLLLSLEHGKIKFCSKNMPEWAKQAIDVKLYNQQTNKSSLSLR